MLVMLVTYCVVLTQGPLGLTFCGGRAMLRCNREQHSGVHLTSGVSMDYTANLRCTVTSSASMVIPRGLTAGRLCLR